MRLRVAIQSWIEGDQVSDSYAESGSNVCARIDGKDAIIILTENVRTSVDCRHTNELMMST